MNRCKRCTRYNKECINQSKRVKTDNRYCLNFILNLHYKWDENDNKQFLKRLGCE